MPSYGARAGWRKVESESGQAKRISNIDSIVELTSQPPSSHATARGVQTERVGAQTVSVGISLCVCELSPYLHFHLFLSKRELPPHIPSALSLQTHCTGLTLGT